MAKLRRDKANGETPSAVSNPEVSAQPTDGFMANEALSQNGSTVQPTIEPVSAVSDAGTPQATTSAPVESAAGDDGSDDEKASSVVVPLTADGRIAFSAVKRESTRAKILKAMGGAQEGFKKSEELAGLTKMAPALWLGVQMLSGWLVTRNAPEGLQAKLTDALAYSREELEMLAGPTAAVMQKYIPAGLADYSDEINLAMTAASIHQEKMMAIKAVFAEYERERKSAPVIPAEPERIHVPPPVPTIGDPQ